MNEIIDDLENLYKVSPVLRELFYEQLMFVLNPAKLKTALCSMRAGKTTAIAADFVADSLLYSESLMFYLGLTDVTIDKIFKPAIKPLLDKYAPDAKILSDEIHFKNGSIISMFGANHPEKVQSFHGLKLRKAAIDEAQSFRKKILTYLVEEVLINRLSDLDGILYLLGTPASHCSGLYYDYTTSGTIPTHTWTAFDNPFMANQWEKTLQATMERKKIDKSHPMIRRNFYAEWCADNESLIIRGFHVVPAPINIHNIRTVIGLDLGFDDEMVFAILGWFPNERKCYVLETIGLFEASVSEIAKMLLSLVSKYRPERVVFPVDTGGKTLMEEFKRKYNINGVVAEKKDKKTYLEILSDACINQDLVLCEKTTERLQQQFKKAVWNDDKTLEHEGCEVDHLDATLYAYRECLHDLEKIIIKKTFTSEDYQKEIIRKMEQEILKGVQKENKIVRKLISDHTKKRIPTNV